MSREVARFRLTSSTIGLFREEGCLVPRSVPVGTIIVVGDVLKDSLVEVTWDGKRILMFAQDIRTRSERLEPDVTLE